MQGRFFPTDIAWYRHLSDRPDLDEVNFWTPSGVGIKCEPLAPLLFKIKKNDGDAIAGFGLVASFQKLPLERAWSLFGEKNGAHSLTQMRERLGKYVGGKRGALAPLDHKIGCIMLASPVFFPESMWVRRPKGWPHNATLGKSYDLLSGEGARVWRDCLATAKALEFAGPLGENVELMTQSMHDGHWHMAMTRLGQNTFRETLVREYGRCAVSGEHSLPALDAAHIKSHARGGATTINNGLLLRADIHRLYDDHYVSVTPDYEFWVSDRLRDEFDNGTVYYDLAKRNSKILLPDNAESWPSRANLEAHYETAVALV